MNLGKVNGKRERPVFDTKEKAEKFAAEKREQRAKEGKDGLGLTISNRADYDEASRLLSPHGVTVHTAAKYYVDHVLAYKAAPDMKGVIQLLLETTKLRGKQEITIKNLKDRLDKFERDFPNRRLHEITLKELENWFNNSGWEPRNFCNYHVAVSRLYNFALNQKWVSENVVSRIDKPFIPATKPEVFTVEQAKALLNHANEFGLLPYIALGLFAGIRPTELTKLDGEAINFAEKTITIGSSVAKKRSQRVVKMESALIDWLRICLPITGRILKVPLRANRTRLRRAAGLAHWPVDAMRHSFGSYHFKHFGSATKTSEQMGHRGTDVFRDYYMVLVTPESATKFWRLRTPATEAILNAREQEETDAANVVRHTKLGDGDWERVWEPTSKLDPLQDVAY